MPSCRSLGAPPGERSKRTIRSSETCICRRSSPRIPGGASGSRSRRSGEEMPGEPVELLASRHADADEMDAYERLLGEAMKGDAALFAREDCVEGEWRIVEPVLGSATPMHEYEP